jgi:glutaredoxin 3
LCFCVYVLYFPRYSLRGAIPHNYMDQKTVTVYSTPTCAFCHMAKEFFNEKGVEFTDYDVAADEAKRNEMMEKTGQMGVPVIEIGDEIVIGFDQARIAALLGL